MGRLKASIIHFWWLCSIYLNYVLGFFNFDIGIDLCKIENGHLNKLSSENGLFVVFSMKLSLTCSLQ